MVNHIYDINTTTLMEIHLIKTVIKVQQHNNSVSIFATNVATT